MTEILANRFGSLFASDRSGRFESWKVSKDGGDAVQVTHSGVSRATESLDGEHIYYAKEGAFSEYRLKGEREKRFCPTSAQVPSR